MLWDTRKAAFDSLMQYTPALRARHHVMKLASGKWTVTLGPPGDVVDALGRTLRAVHVRGREWKQVPPTTRGDDREWWQDAPSHHHATKKSPAQLQREIDEVLLPDDAWRWQNVRMKHRGRELLGTVRHVRRDPAGKLHLVVHHFNGEPWPMEPVSSAVKII